MGSYQESLYNDQPLHTKTSIRLLSLCQEDTKTGLSDNADSLIQLNLQVVDLDRNPPSFQALSYTWGSPFLDEEMAREYDHESNPRYVILNGWKVEIRRNLCEFIQLWASSPRFIYHSPSEASLPAEHPGDNVDPLGSSRELDPRPVMYLWVDALCINQDDLMERKEQVTLMSRIYTKATMVLVWLGIEDKSVEDAVQFVSELKTQSYGEAMNRSDTTRAANDWWLNRTWFTRAWVIQEVALAQRIRLLCGSQSIDYWQFFQSLNSISLDGTQGAGVPLFVAKGTGTGSYQPLHLIDIRIRISSDSRERKIVCQNITQPVAAWEQKPSLPVLLSMSWAFQATDPRDKIYSLLGISRDEARHEIDPDYEADAADLIVRVGRIFMGGSPDEPIQRWTSGSCEVLEPLEGLSFVESGNSSDLELPSWIASFGVARTCTRLWLLNFNAGRVELGTKMDLILPSGNPRDLHLKGINCDAVVKVIQLGSPANIDHKLPLFASDLPPTYYQTGESREEALRRTLLADQTEYPLPDLETEDFDPSLCDKTHAIMRSIFQTQKGYIGLGSLDVEPGDEVWLIAGARTPYILCSLPEVDDSEEATPERVLVEEAYVHGMMYGERMDEEELEEVILV